MDYARAVDANESLVAVLSIPNPTQTDPVLAVFNKRSGGYRLVQGTRVVEDASGGEVISAYFSGAAVYVHLRQAGEYVLKRYLVNAEGVISTNSTWPISGDLIGAYGDVVWLRYGNSISALSVIGQELVPALAQSLSDAIIAVQVDNTFAYVLTKAGIYRFSFVVNDLPIVQQESFYCSLRIWMDSMLMQII